MIGKEKKNKIKILKKKKVAYTICSGRPANRCRPGMLIVMNRFLMIFNTKFFRYIFSNLVLFIPSDTDNQRVIVQVKDVNDEPPYFINRPLPMQAVVQLNAPPNTPVFTLQARDPDTDHNIHYFLVRDRSKK